MEMQTTAISKATPAKVVIVRRIIQQKEMYVSDIHRLASAARLAKEDVME